MLQRLKARLGNPSAFSLAQRPGSAEQWVILFLLFALFTYLQYRVIIVSRTPFGTHQLSILQLSVKEALHPILIQT